MMEKIFWLIFLFCLLILAYGNEESNLSDNNTVREYLDNLNIEEGDEVELFELPSWTSERGSKILVNVDGLGAVGDGISDDTQVIYMHVLYASCFAVYSRLFCLSQVCRTFLSLVLEPPSCINHIVERIIHYKSDTTLPL